MIIPLLGVLLFFGLHFTELIHAKLKLQEVTRYAAFEMTSHPLTNYSSGDHDRAFARAAQKTREDVLARYQALDSAERASAIAGGRGFENFGVRLENRTVNLSGDSLPNSEGEGGGWLGPVLDRLSGTVSAATERLGFNSRGAVEAEASVTFRGRLLPLGYTYLLQARGGPDLDRFALTSRYTLIASGWHLPDGRDAIVGRHRAGVYRGDERPTVLYQQVSRMTFLGAKERFRQLPGLSTALRALRGVAPDPTGTFVVSHNYGLVVPADQRGCRYLQGYPPAARSGLNNLRAASEVDFDRPTCFDTAPFRDHAEYESSLYVRIFEARGRWFLGCKNAAADNPAEARDLSSGDESPKVNCQ
jgi:hypothetical protein